jgi:hypothetical protein
MNFLHETTDAKLDGHWCLVQILNRDSNLQSEVYAALTYWHAMDLLKSAIRG